MKLKRLFEWFGAHKKITAPIGVVLIAGLLGFGLYVLIRSQSVNRTLPSGDASASQAAIKFKPSPLTGVEVSPELAERPVVAFVIENTPDARPQSSLNQAGVLYEAIAEGGITRFVALYQESKPELIGPVRSLRPYFIDWAMQFDAAVGHVGGSEQAKQEAKSMGMKDIDQFFNGSSYFRSTDRVAPHNVYTTTERIDALLSNKGFTSSNFESWPRKKEDPSQAPNATSIDINISSALYNPSYQYDPGSNSYLRSEAGEPHKDRESGQQLKPKVVIVLKAEYSNAGGSRLAIQTTGSGEAYVFQDGTVTKGTWKKDSRTSQLKLANEAGETIKLNPGQTWVSVIATNRSVTYK